MRINLNNITPTMYSDFYYHTTWEGMIRRCANKKDKNYGGRGIKVCKRWMDSVDNFIEDMGKRPSEKYSIDRIDNDGDYCKENCRWATREQQNNNRSCCTKITYKGRTQTRSQWAKEFGMTPATLKNRLKVLKWSLKKSLETPVRSYYQYDYKKDL